MVSNILPFLHTKITLVLLHSYVTILNLIFSCQWLATRSPASRLTWNRTVNLRGQIDTNDEADLVNEFLNKEFKGTILNFTETNTQDNGSLFK